MKKVRAVSYLVCFFLAAVLLTPCAFAVASVVCPGGHSMGVSTGKCGLNSDVSIYCSCCNKVYKFTFTASHKWAESGRTEPTTTSEGIITYQCSYCGETKSESIPKLEPVECTHDWIETGRTEPTTTSEGTITYECSNCGEIKSESIPKLEECIHKWMETDRIEPTTTTPGQITYVCQKCGLVETKSIPVKPVYDGTFMNWLGSVVGLFNMTMNEIMGFQSTEFFMGVLVFMTMFSLLAKLIQQGRRGRL